MRWRSAIFTDRQGPLSPCPAPSVDMPAEGEVTTVCDDPTHGRRVGRFGDCKITRFGVLKDWNSEEPGEKYDTHVVRLKLVVLLSWKPKVLLLKSRLPKLKTQGASERGA